MDLVNLRGAATLALFITGSSKLSKSDRRRKHHSHGVSTMTQETACRNQSCKLGRRSIWYRLSCKQSWRFHLAVGRNPATPLNTNVRYLKRLQQEGLLIPRKVPEDPQIAFDQTKQTRPLGQANTPTHPSTEVEPCSACDSAAAPPTTP